MVTELNGLYIRLLQQKLSAESDNACTHVGLYSVILWWM